jgi:uncharacterized protein (TIGR03435 family)
MMLRPLLADRFKLRFHYETRRIKMLAVVLDREGATFRASRDQEQKERVIIEPGRISGVAIPFGHFVSILEAQLGYPTINETGLSGKYDLALKYVRDESPGVDGPSIEAALADQLGLRLKARTAPVEVFVIDSAYRLRAD